MLARWKSLTALAALAAVSALFAVTDKSASQTRAPARGAAQPGPAATGAPMHGPTALGFLEFDWNGVLPGFSPWRGDATTADIFPHQTSGSE